MALQPCRASLARSSRQIFQSVTPCLRTFSTESPAASAAAAAADAPSAPVPRWSQTPPQMKAPLQLDHAKNPHNKVWKVNNDPRKLDEVYDRLLGTGGSRLLPEELKWLAITHKSFDQGRRGFNDRLALLGRMTLVMETTKNIVAMEPIKHGRMRDEFERTPFEHPQLGALDNLNILGPKDVAGKEKLYLLGAECGLIDVVRWKPRLVHKLKSSGVEVILNGAIFAIIGAITLQHGSVVAAKIVRERILSRLRKD